MPVRRRSAWGRVFGLDLVLLHAPSVWDFRQEVILQGPLADVIPSTDEFEMYPIGLTSIAAYLELNHYNTRLVNLAYRMLRNRRFDVAGHLAGLDAPVFGIDLHWLPHANGALGIAELVKHVADRGKCRSTITEDVGAPGDVGVCMIVDQFMTITASPSRSWTATGASQSGHEPPMPIRRMKPWQVSQYCSPRARSPQVSHS
jgi:hypothetical protein